MLPDWCLYSSENYRLQGHGGEGMEDRGHRKAIHMFKNIFHACAIVQR